LTLAVSASLDALRLRADLLAQIRRFFAARRVLEVETPALSSAAAPDPSIESVAAQVRSLLPHVHFLHTSPEYAMKRLLAEGAGDIYQICRVFRDGEIGRWHQPEFTLLEWYRVGWDEANLMAEVEALLNELIGPRRRLGETARLTYRRAFLDRLGVDPFDAAIDVASALAARGMEVPQGLDHDGVLDLGLSLGVVPSLPPDRLTFLVDFPPSQAALARIRPGPPPVAARFEAFAYGIELANGFAELTDATEQRQRFEAHRARRAALGRPDAPIDEDFLRALERLPECAGVAVGLDRVVALAAGLTSVASAMSLAHESAPGGITP
jgi:lysyl-tRNA synthetase class 2